MSTIRADNFGNRAGTSSVSADTVLQGTAKAWFTLTGTGTIAGRDSFNIASYTDNGTGDYSASFSVAMPNANYCYVSAAEDASVALFATNFTSSPKTVSSIRTNTRYVSDLTGNATPNDADSLLTAIHGDPA